MSVNKEELKFLKQVLLVERMAAKLFKNHKKAVEWMCTPSQYFWGESPLHYIVKGQGDTLIEYLKERSE